MKLFRLFLPLSLSACWIGISSHGLAQDETSNNGSSFVWNIGSWTLGVPTLSSTAYIFAGTVTVENDVEVGRIRFTGGALQGNTDAATDSLTLAGHSSNSIWSGGIIRDLSVIISQNGALNISDSVANNMNAASLIIESADGYGLANWTQGTLQLDNGSKIENSGDFDDSASSRIHTSTGAKGTFHNQSEGDYNKTGGGNTEIDVTFNNDGTVNVEAGALILDGGGTSSSSGSFEVDAETLLRFSNSYTVEDASTITGSGQVELTNGTLTLDGEVGVSDFAIKGGTLTGTHTFNNDATWSEGTLKNGSTTNAVESTFKIQSEGDNNLNGHTFTNEGTVNWTDGDIIADNGTTINNSGVFNDSLSDDHDIRRFTGAAATFNNSGTYHKTGSAKTEIKQEFNNSGTVDLDAGFLVIDGMGEATSTGSFEVNSGATLRFDNTYSITDAAKITGTGQVELTNGTLTLNGNVGVPDFAIKGGNLTGTHTFTNDATWSEGTIKDGSTTNAAESVFNIQSAADNNLTAHTFSNAGTSNWTDGDIQADNGTTINNSGTFNDSLADDHEFRRFTGASAVFNNSGTYHKTGAAKTTFQQEFNNSGTVDVDAGFLVIDGGGSASSTGSFEIDSGATLRFDSNYTIADAAKITGSGQAELTNGTLTLDGDVSSADFAIKGGVLSGTHTFNNGATWSEGLLRNGSTTNASNSTFNIQSETHNNFDGHALINAGTVNWSDGDLQGDNGSSINNTGTFNDSITDDHEIRRSTGASFSLTNTGTYHKTGAAKTEIDVTFNNSGNVDIDAGTLVIDGGGSTDSTGGFEVNSGATLQLDSDYTIANASRLTGTGVIKATAGTLNLSGTVGISDFRIEGGTITGTQTFNQGATLLDGGFGSGITINASGSVLNLSDSGGNRLTDREILNQGTINWTSGNIDARSGSRITNRGTFNDTADGNFTTSSGTAGFFNNGTSGTYNKNGSGTTEFDRTFNSEGTVNVNAGTLKLDGGGVALEEAVFHVASGARLQFDSGYSIADAAGLSGDGAFDLTSGLLNIGGIISVDFLQDGGNIDGTFEIAGTFDWEDGFWDAASTETSTTIRSTGTLNINDTTSYFRDRDIINDGTVNWTGGTLLTNAAGSFTNNGTFNDNSDSDHNISESSGSATFQNNGTFNKTGAGTTRVDQTFNNTSPRTLNVSSGVLELNGGGTNSSGAAMSVSNDGLIRFTDNYTIENAADLSASELSGNHGYELTDGDLDLDGTLSVDLVQTGGELDGTHNIAGRYDWNGGRLSADNDGESTTIDSTGELNINIINSIALYLNRDISNQGTVNWIDGNLATNAEGSFSNHGTFNDKLDHDHLFSGAPSFSNTGTYTKSDIGTTEFDSSFDNDGTVNVNAGILKLDGGGLAGSMGTFDVGAGGTLQFDNDYTVSEASNLTGDGKFQLSGGDLTLEGNLAVDFEQTGGNLDGSQVISSTFDFGGWGDWNAAVDGANTRITPTGVLNLLGNDKTFNNRDIINEGIVNWTEGDFRTDAEGSFTNQGTFNDKTSADLDIDDSNGQATFTNSGTFEKTGNSRTRIGQDFVNSGDLRVQQGTLQFTDDNSHSATATITVASGALVQLSANTTLTNGVEITGGGTIEQTSSTLSGAAQFDTAFEKIGGTLDGDFKFSSRFDMTGGLIAAGSNVDLVGTANGTLDVTSLALDDTVFKVETGSTLNWSRGSINTGNDGGLDIDGQLINSFDATLSQTLAGDGFLDVSGSFRKTGGTETTSIQLPVTLSGRLESHSGTVALVAGGTSNAGIFDIFKDADIRISNGFTFNDDTTVQNGGSLQLTGGTFVINDSVNLGQQTSITGGTLSGTHTLEGNIVVNGGYFDGSGTTTVAEGASLEFANVEDNPLDRSFVNNGKILWSGGDMTGSGENSLTNEGEFAVSVDGTFGASPGEFSIENNGFFTKTGGTGTTTIDVPFTNNGTISAETGQFRFTDTLTFGGDATLGGGVQFDSPVALPASSTLAGNGTIMGSITTGGTVSPGNSIGSLSITGDLTLLSTSNSFFEVSASTDPISSDFVSVSGTLTLAGNLSWDLFASLDPVQTDMFTLYSAGNLTGAFANVANGGRLFAADMNRSFVVNYGSSSLFDPNQVVFSNFEFTPIPEPSTWALMMMGLGLVGMRITRRPRRA